MNRNAKDKPAATKARVATIWLDGCSGCHMSFLDMDERLLALAEQIELVYSPLVDQKEFPPQVDVAIVEVVIPLDGLAIWNCRTKPVDTRSNRGLSVFYEIEVLHLFGGVLR